MVYLIKRHPFFNKLYHVISYRHMVVPKVLSNFMSDHQTLELIVWLLIHRSSEMHIRLCISALGQIYV